MHFVTIKYTPCLGASAPKSSRNLPPKTVPVFFRSEIETESVFPNADILFLRQVIARYTSTVKALSVRSTGR